MKLFPNYKPVIILGNKPSNLYYTIKFLKLLGINITLFSSDGNYYTIKDESDITKEKFNKNYNKLCTIDNIYSINTVKNDIKILQCAIPENSIVSIENNECTIDQIIINNIVYYNDYFNDTK
jgi:hypothetical protein